MELLSFIITVFGLVICFGGVYFKKFCSAAIGFAWGGLFSIIFILLTTQSIWAVDSDESVIWILLGAIAFAFLSAKYDKACAFLNSFIPTFF